MGFGAGILSSCSVVMCWGAVNGYPEKIIPPKPGVRGAKSSGTRQLRIYKSNSLVESNNGFRWAKGQKAESKFPRTSCTSFAPESAKFLKFIDFFYAGNFMKLMTILGSEKRHISGGVDPAGGDLALPA